MSWLKLREEGITPEGGSYLGNMESGTNKQADIYATVDGIDGGEGECNGKYVVTYEDEYGETYKEEIPFKTYMMQMVYDDVPIDDVPIEEESPQIPVVIWIIIAAGVGAVVFVVVKKVKAKKALEVFEDDEDDDFN